MLDKIISGRQSGAEQAALRVASAFGIAQDGEMPMGVPTGDETYDDGASRIERCVRDSDATLWFGETTTANAQATVRASQRFSRPCMPVYPGASFEPSHIVAWIEHNAVKTLYVTGIPEDEEPGIGGRVERFLTQVLQQLGHEPS